VAPQKRACSSADCPYESDIQDNKIALWGNGRAGLIERVTRMSERLKLLCWIGGVLVTAIVAQVVLAVASKIGA